MNVNVSSIKDEVILEYIDGKSLFLAFCHTCSIECISILSCQLKVKVEFNFLNLSCEMTTSQFDEAKLGKEIKGDFQFLVMGGD